PPSTPQIENDGDGQEQEGGDGSVKPEAAGIRHTLTMAGQRGRRPVRSDSVGTAPATQLLSAPKVGWPARRPAMVRWVWDLTALGIAARQAGIATLEPDKAGI